MNKSQQQTLYTAPFMKRYGIKPFPVDPQTMDLDGDFLQGLMSSVKAGYDASRPIIVAKSDDERIDGYLIDGRHRCYVLGKLQEQNIPLPNPFPIAFLDVKDANHLRALIAQYEQVGMSKSARYAKNHIQQNLKAIVEEKYQELGDGIFSFIQSLGFSNAALVADVVDSISDRKSSKRKVSKATSEPIVPSLPPHLTQRWTDESVYAKEGERFDILIDFKHSCPDCKAPLKIVTDITGKVVKVESAPKIPQ
jgi:hypothetical protein